MKITRRSLSREQDNYLMSDLAQQCFENNLHIVDLPELDIVVESPDDRLVAFCICWFDRGLMAGHVESLGCHKDFRQYALGRVALSEGLWRLQSLGAQNIFVETDNYRNTAFRLYESFDFQVMQNVLVYRKDYGDVRN